MKRNNYSTFFSIYSILLIGLVLCVQQFLPIQSIHFNEAVPLSTDLQTNEISVNIAEMKSNDLLVINCQSSSSFEGTITIFNLIGRKLDQFQKEFVQGDQKVSVDISQLVAGQYVIAVNDGNQSIAKKFILDNEHP